MDAKRRLRARLVAARDRRDRAQIDAAGASIAAHGVSLWSGVRCAAAYAAIGTEPPTRELLDGLRAAGVEVLLPIVASDELHWAPYEGWSALRPGRFDIPEPAAVARASLQAADVALVPALAVDRSGHRLGRGAGYYDRALAAVERERIVAVVFDDEVLDDVPVEPHDQLVGAALTPGGLMPLGGAGSARPGC